MSERLEAAWAAGIAVERTESTCVLQSQKDEAPAVEASLETAAVFAVIAQGVAQYRGASWVPSPNFWRGRSSKIRKLVVHTVQGTYGSCINWFQNPASEVSAQYVVSGGGAVTQMVREEDTAWHVGTANPYCVGAEFEGFVDDGKPPSEAMLKAGASLFAYLCTKHNLRPERDIIVGHRDLPNQTHTDPGNEWPMARFIGMVKALMAPANPAPLPGVGAPEYAYFGYSGEADEAIAVAAAGALQRAGYRGAVLAPASDVAMQSAKVMDVAPGKRVFLVIGAPAVAILAPEAKKARMYPVDASSNVWDCVGSSYGHTQTEMGWRLLELCRRLGVKNAEEVLKDYRRRLPKAPPEPKPTDPSSRAWHGVNVLRSFAGVDFYDTFLPSDDDIGGPLWSDRMPSRAEIIAEGDVCSFAGNALCHSLGKKPPKYSTWLRGGTGSWGEVYNKPEFRYDPNRVYDPLTMFLRRWTGDTPLPAQGHLGFSTTKGKPDSASMMQSIPDGGLREDLVVAWYHRVGGWQLAIPFSRWA